MALGHGRGDHVELASNAPSRRVGFIVGGAGKGNGVVDNLCAGGMLISNAAALQRIVTDDDLRPYFADGLRNGANHLRVLDDDAVVKAEKDHVLPGNAEAGAGVHDLLLLVAPALRLDGVEIGLFLRSDLALSELLGENGVMDAQTAGERGADHPIARGNMAGQRASAVVEHIRRMSADDKNGELLTILTLVFHFFAPSVRMAALTGPARPAARRIRAAFRGRSPSGRPRPSPDSEAGSPRR